jgi:site-specific recombinase XerD
LLVGGTDVKLIQLLLGQNDIEITMRYAHLRSRRFEKIGSRFDWLNL